MRLLEPRLGWTLLGLLGPLGVLGPTLVALGTPRIAAASGEPWFQRPSCDAVEKLIFAGALEQAEPALSALEASRDPDDQACGVWVRMSLAEYRIAFFGQTPELLEEQDRRLGRMYGFARAHEKLGARFRDLALEARIRRIRVLFAGNKRQEAVKEARRVQALLDAPRSDPATPSYDYTIGLVNSAVAFSPWAARALLKVAGISGDGELGYQALRRLVDGPTVYRHEAVYVSHHFAEQEPTGPFGPPTSYSARLHQAFPANATFAFDAAIDLWRAGQCDQALLMLEPLTRQLESAPESYSGAARARLYWLSGTCVLARGDKTGARRFADLAAGQGFAGLAAEIAQLKARL
jgi:hypothetical protein